MREKIRRPDACNENSSHYLSHSPLWRGGTYRLLLFIILVSFSICPAAWAVLGASATSVEADRLAVNGQTHTMPGMGYSTTTVTGVGLTIAEYSLPDNNQIVFGVTWKGTAAPDLSVLLGSYYEEYLEGLRALAQEKSRARRPLILKTAHLRIERGGHARHMWGRVVLLGLVPSSVSIQDLP